MTEALPSASYSIVIRCRLQRQPGMFGRLATAIGAAGGLLGAIDLVRQEKDLVVRDVTVNCRDDAHGDAIVAAVRAVDGLSVLHVSDCTFLLHLGGKIEVVPKTPLRTRDDLSMAYAPGVARVCRAIAADPSRAFNLTIKRNTVAVVTDGTAVLGLGDLGPLAALPVMEGKALLFKEFGGVDAFPICLDTTDADEIVETVVRLAPTFGGINLEDISAPRCFEIERRLKERLDIPVFHDDQHGTAVVALAALLNACRRVGKPLPGLRVVISGVGAAVAVARILLASGVADIVGCDRAGALYQGRIEHMNPVKRWFAEHTNPAGRRGQVADVIAGADVFIGVSAPGALAVADVRRMAPDPIVFALANPDPEIAPQEVEGLVRVMATGRSDYPNQINNVLCFPGMFRGALDVQATDITEGMKLAAARAIAGVVTSDALAEDYVIPSVFDRRVADAVAAATAATADGVARRPRADHQSRQGVPALEPLEPTAATRLAPVRRSVTQRRADRRHSIFRGRLAAPPRTQRRTSGALKQELGTNQGTLDVRRHPYGSSVLRCDVTKQSSRTRSPSGSGVAGITEASLPAWGRRLHRAPPPRCSAQPAAKIPSTTSSAITTTCIACSSLPPKYWPRPLRPGSVPVKPEL